MKKKGGEDKKYRKKKKKKKKKKGMEFVIGSMKTICVWNGMNLYGLLWVCMDISLFHF